LEETQLNAGQLWAEIQLGLVIVDRQRPFELFRAFAVSTTTGVKAAQFHFRE